MIYGVDVSAYQPAFDFAACAREGYDFAFIKSTEGPGWRSPNYADQVARARDAGLLVAAYHYVNGTDVGGQLRNIQAVVSKDTPVILDVEANAGNITSIRALNTALNEAGYRTPLIYIPRWYWTGTMGSPDLTGLPPNWHSAYIDQVQRKDAKVYNDFLARESTWTGFGGIPIAVAQFTSALAVANYPGGRIDGNAYRGTREQLAALLGGEVDDVSAEDVLFNQKIKGPEGDTPYNLNDMAYWTNKFVNLLPEMAAKLDVVGTVVAGIAARDGQIELSDEQAERLNSRVEAILTVSLDELATKLEGLSKEDMRAVLRESRWVMQSAGSANPDASQ